jgi:hypothetical protein
VLQRAASPLLARLKHNLSGCANFNGLAARCTAGPLTGADFDRVSIFEVGWGRKNYPIVRGQA